MWPFSSEDNEPERGFDGLYHTDVQIEPDARHVDVAILWGLGMKNRAHHLAKELRPQKYVVGFTDENISDMELKRVRDVFQDAE